MKRREPGGLLADFEAGRLDPGQFPHSAHVEVGYELLERHSFPEALLHLARGLRRLAAKAGRPEVYHETITTAFLAVIAERRLRSTPSDWSAFAAQNPDLLRRNLLAQIYEPARLQSDIARQTFVLPTRVDPAPGSECAAESAGEFVNNRAAGGLELGKSLCAWPNQSQRKMT